MSALRAFAERHRLRVRRDEDGTGVILGSTGRFHQHDARRLSVTVLAIGPDGPLPLSRGTRMRWRHRRRLGLAAGMVLQLDGDDEGMLLFDPTNDAQVVAAFKIARPKRRRLPSPAQLAVLAEAREVLRTGAVHAQNRDEAPEGYPNPSPDHDGGSTAVSRGVTP